MENTQNTTKKNTRYETFRAMTPRILACCWFLGGILIGFLVFIGVTSYNGTVLDVSNCLDWIIDIQHLQGNRLQYYAARLLLAVLYMVYVIRILKQILQGANSFRWVIQGKGDEYSRTQALLHLNERFGKICGMAVMHVVWARLISSQYALSEGRFVMLTAAVIFMLTGLVVNYAYERPSTVRFTVVDTARNLLAVLVAWMLMRTLNVAALDELYRGVVYLVNYFEAVNGGVPFDLKQTLLLLYERLFYPVLRMILWIGTVKIIALIFGDHRYYTNEKTGKRISRRFQKTLVFSCVLAALFCVTRAMCKGLRMQSVFPDAVKVFLPIVLLCVAGKLLFRFSYPEEYAAEASDMENVAAEEVQECTQEQSE